MEKKKMKKATDKDADVADDDDDGDDSEDADDAGIALLEGDDDVRGSSKPDGKKKDGKQGEECDEECMQKKQDAIEAYKEAVQEKKDAVQAKKGEEAFPGPEKDGKKMS